MISYFLRGAANPFEDFVFSFGEVSYLCKSEDSSSFISIGSFLETSSIFS
jgi:hypothetical protein